MTHLELAAVVETMRVADSKAEELLGKNVRCPSLVPGTLYIMKEWSVKHHVNSDNPFSVVEFVGCGYEENDLRVIQDENFAIKEMKQGDYYFFKAIDSVKQEPYVFGAYMSDNCVCIKSCAVRVTCYAIKGHESEGFDSTPKEKVVKAKQPKANKKESIEAADEASLVDYGDDEDDENGSPLAVVCHPISMIPLRRQPKGFGGNV